MPFSARQLEINRLRKELGKPAINFTLTPRQREIARLKQELEIEEPEEERSLLDILARPITAIPEVFSEGVEQIQEPGFFNKLGGAASIPFSPVLGPARAIGEGAESLAETAGVSPEGLITPKRTGTGVDILSSLVLPGAVGGIFSAFSKLSKFFSRSLTIPKSLKDIKGLEQDFFRISKGKRSHLQRISFTDDIDEILKRTKGQKGPSISFKDTEKAGMELGMTAENMSELLKRVPTNELSKYIDAAQVITIKTMTEFKGILDKLPKNIALEASDETLAVALNAMFNVYSVNKALSSFTSEVGRALRQTSRLKSERLAKLFSIKQGIKTCSK